MKHIKTFENYDDESEHDIKKILDAYLECIIFTQSEQQEDGEDDPFEGKSIHNFFNSSIIEARKQIEWFVDVAGEAIDNISDESIGHDIWYTRNGHGVGFWDRGYDEDVVEILEKLCKILGYADTYVSDTDEIVIQTNYNYKNFDVEKYKEEYKLQKSTRKYNL